MSSTKAPSTKQLTTDIPIARNLREGEVGLGASISIPSLLELKVLDCRSFEPVTNLSVREIVVSGGPEERAEPFPPMGTPPDYVMAPTQVQLDKAKKSVQSLETRASDEPEGGAVHAKLRKAKKELEALNAKARAHLAWENYLLSALTCLGMYDGPLDALIESGSDAARAITRAWASFGKGKYDRTKVAAVLSNNLHGRSVTAKDGCLRVPIPLGKKGTVRIEFAHVKVLDPTELKSIGIDPERAPPDCRVDRDLADAKDVADLPESKEEKSRWKWVRPHVLDSSQDEMYFRNWISIHFDTTEKADAKPEATSVLVRRHTTLAMVWCQPAWTVVDPKYIYDPRTDHEVPSQIDPHFGKVTERRFAHRGLDRTGAPTLLMSTKALPHFRSKYYGAYGSNGRQQWDKSKRAFVPKMHSGVDVGGKEGDPLFALIGGKVGSLVSDDGKSDVGNFPRIIPWWSSDERPDRFDLLHAKENVVKKNQVVKAGDIIAIMGRTGNFRSAPQSPTHAHFQCALDLSGLNGRVLPLSVFPNNGLPLLLPCAGQQGYGRDGGGSERFEGCNFVDDRYAAARRNCFAVRELACPFMPDVPTAQAVEAELKSGQVGPFTIRLHAQLRWYFLSRSSENVAGEDPPNGPSNHGLVVVKAKLKQRVYRTNEASQAKVELKAGESWLLYQDEPIQGTYRIMLEGGGIARVPASAVIVNPASILRKAIRKFRDELEIPHDGSVADAGTVTDAVLSRLEGKAPIVPQSPALPAGRIVAPPPKHGDSNTKYA